MNTLYYSLFRNKDNRKYLIDNSTTIILIIVIVITIHKYKVVTVVGVGNVGV